MSNFKIVEPSIGAPSPVSLTATTQLWPLGFVAKAADHATGSARLGDGLFQYCVGATAGAPQSIGQLVQIRGNSAALAGTANRLSNFALGLAAGAISATNVYGWVQIKGLADYGRCSNHDIAVGASAFVASTTGLIATTQGATAAGINGIHFPVSLTSTQSLSVTMELNFPAMNIGSAL
jgi:hypothetical protein